MDKLSEEQRTALIITATERLRAKLVKACYDEEEVFSIERPALLEAMAKVLVQRLATGGNQPVTSIRTGVKRNSS